METPNELQPEQIAELTERDRAAELLESLKVAADGGPTVSIGSWEASTLVMLIEDAKYRRKVRYAHDKAYGTN